MLNGHVPDGARTCVLPIRDALAVAKAWVGVFGLHQFQCLNLTEVVALACGHGFDPVQINRGVRHLDAAHGAQDRTAHIIINHQSFARGGHDRPEHANRQVDHVRARLGGQSDGIAFFIARLCIGCFGVCHASRGGRGQAQMQQQLCCGGRGHGGLARTTGHGS